MVGISVTKKEVLPKSSRMGLKVLRVCAQAYSLNSPINS